MRRGGGSLQLHSAELALSSLVRPPEGQMRSAGKRVQHGVPSERGLCCRGNASPQLGDLQVSLPVENQSCLAARLRVACMISEGLL